MQANFYEMIGLASNYLNQNKQKLNSNDEDDYSNNKNDNSNHPNTKRARLVDKFFSGKLKTKKSKKK